MTGMVLSIIEPLFSFSGHLRKCKHSFYTIFKVPFLPANLPRNYFYKFVKIQNWLRSSKFQGERISSHIFLVGFNAEFITQQHDVVLRRFCPKTLETLVPLPSPSIYLG